MKLPKFAALGLVVSCAAAPAKAPNVADGSSASPAAPSAPAEEPAPSANPADPTGAEPLEHCKVADRISGKRARALVEGGATLVDVRTPKEFAERHVAEARNIPVDELEGRLSELSKEHPVVVYCRAGGRAARAATLLRAAGFTAHNMGGVDSWDRPDC